jgi:hypothetical protein
LPIKLLKLSVQDNKYFNGKEKVGMAEDLPLARRVQLAALSHIRHTMTRYDELLKEGQKWENARKAVEKPCLDIIVKWRGDEETGRDQLDEILREVIEISDDEDSEEDDTTEEEAAPEASGIEASKGTMPSVARTLAVTQESTPLSRVRSTRTPRRDPSVISLTSPVQPKKLTRKERKAVKQTQQRFKRYAQVAETFRHEPQPMSVPGHTEPAQQPGRNTPSSHAPLHPGARSYQDTSYSAPRLRGQSPIFVRVADSSVPKVGQPASHRSYATTPVSPVRNQFQDMLVRSIEPHSPGAPYAHERASSYSFSAETDRVPGAPRVVGPPVVEQPVVRPYSVTSFHEPAMERRIISQPTEHSEMFSGAGFIQVHREREYRGLTQDHPGDYARGRTALTSRQYDRRSRSPVASGHEAIHREPARVMYRSRAGTIYVGEPTVNGRDDIAPRLRNHPIVLDSPSVPSRVLETRQHMDITDYELRPTRRSDLSHQVSVQEAPNEPIRPQVVYMDEPNPRLVHIRGHQAERRSPQIIAVDSRLEPRPLEVLPYRNNPPQIHPDSRSRVRLAERPVMRYTDATDYAYPEDTFHPQGAPPPHHSREDRYGHERQEYVSLQDPGHDQSALSQTFPGREYPTRPVSYY